MLKVKIELKANQQGQIYFPKLLRDQWGNEYVLIPNAQGGYVYPKGVTAKDALRSLEVVRKDLEHRAELEERLVTEKKVPHPTIKEGESDAR